MFAARKDYDLILFGVTGFTGRLAAEHLTKTEPNLRWAACARNEAKAKQVLQEVNAAPSIEIADLVCDDDAALKGYLHGEPHKAWVPVARPNFEGDPPSLIFDCPLMLSAEV